MRAERALSKRCQLPRFCVRLHQRDTRVRCKLSILTRTRAMQPVVRAEAVPCSWACLFPWTGFLSGLLRATANHVGGEGLRSQRGNRRQNGMQEMD